MRLGEGHETELDIVRLAIATSVQALTESYCYLTFGMLCVDVIGML